TNSWGCSGCAGSYDDSSQAFDVGVRDADLDEAGNQQLIVFFSAGNSGPTSGTIGTPGNGKNMITVGASENDRPSDEDGNWTDGCGIGPTGADSAMDVISFSSRGPAPGNRVKPEVIAPGTHIQGT
ncbi:MAG: S8 family serine peptidase, partial [Desulfuromonadales bacterium]|nr:S8 family serine peptidase [Desulfuromonadales bacterium]